MLRTVTFDSGFILATESPTGLCALRSISSLPGSVARSVASTSGACICEDISTDIVLPLSLIVKLRDVCYYTRGSGRQYVTVSGRKIDKSV